jgi:dephospho-CoA kinase
MIKAGITGGIGSGKTTICKIFSILGVPIYHADERAKILLSQSPDIREQIKETFGEEIYTDGTILNREKLAQIIFNDKGALTKINSMIHPLVYADFFHWCKSQISHYVLLEAAIMFESGGYQKLDKTIMINAPEDLRITRVIERDNVSNEQVLARMRNQWPEERKVPLADFIINNDGNSMLIPVVLKIHKTLSEL